MTDSNGPAGLQYAPAFVEQLPPIPGSAQHLHEQHQIEAGILERKLASLGLRQKRGFRFVKLRLNGKLLQHGMRRIHSNVEIARCQKSPADPPSSRANIKDARSIRKARHAPYGGTNGFHHGAG
jgi:hypothetical protein